MSVAVLLDSKENPVIYKGPRKTNLIKTILKETFWGKLDYLICDTPPGTSDEHLTIVKLIQQIKPDGAILVSTPQKLSMNAVRKEITFCKKMKLKIIGLIENMGFFVCPCCNVSKLLNSILLFNVLLIIVFIRIRTIYFLELA